MTHLVPWHRVKWHQLLLALLSSKDLLTALHFGAAGLVWRKVMCSQNGVYTACFPNDAWANLKDNNKNHTSKSKFSCFLQNKYCDNSCNVNHWNNITVIIKNDRGDHSSLPRLIWEPERWQIMPPSSWQMIHLKKNHLLKRTCFKFHELIKYF